MKYIALCIWALVKAPFTLGDLYMTHLNETELRKDLLFYHYVFGVRGGIVEGRREEGREREKVRGTDTLNTNFTMIHSMKKTEFILFNPFPNWESPFSASLTYGHVASV